MDYSSLKDLAKSSKVKVADLLALSPQNDPFYVGTPASVEQGTWFASLWQRFNYGNGVHVRRVHYQTISQDPPVLMPDGQPYVNTLECWQYLVGASKQARYLGLVDPYSFVDKRNPDAEVYSSWTTEDNLEVTLPTMPDESLPDFPDLPSVYFSQARTPQAYRLEVWAEKSTMNDVLIPWCQRYGATLQCGLGELSITAVTAFVNRCKADNRPTVVLYVSDFDPAGRSMPVAISRKIEFLTVGSSANVQLYPVVLTPDQVSLYRLPRTPIKESERRGARFEQRFGEGAVELDALEALHPGELDKTLTRFILDARFFDASLSRQDYYRGLDFRSLLDGIETAPTHRQQYADLLDSYNDLREEMASRYAAIREDYNALALEVQEDLTSQLPELPALPTPATAAPLVEPLLDTSRDYMTQLAYYRTWQGKDNAE
jgi:hypothetical protein